MKFRPLFTKEFLEKEIQNGKTAVKIATENSCCTETVFKYLRKFGIKLKRRSILFQSLTGKRYGTLVVLSRAKNDKFGKAKWLCKCDCGEKKIVNACSLKRGLTQSCGCKKISKVRKNGIGDISYQYFRRIRRTSLDRGINFDISIKYIWDIYNQQNGRCSLTGLFIKFEPCGNNITKQTASVDRIDNTKGYIKGNIQIVHKRANVIKGNMSIDELKFWIYHMYKNLKVSKEDNIQLNGTCILNNGLTYEIKK
jgi:hypothetical protein